MSACVEPVAARRDRVTTHTLRNHGDQQCIDLSSIPAGSVKSEASTAEKEEMTTPKMDTERISSLRLKWRATNIPLTPNHEAETTVQERHLCIT